MDYTKLGTEIEFAKDEDFYRRVKFALAKSAKGVLVESDQTANHAARAQFAARIVAGDYSLIPMIYAICTDPTIEAANRLNAVTDAQIQSATDSLFNVLAGIG